MKKTYFYLIILVAGLSVIVAFKSSKEKVAQDLGVAVKSITALTFGPDGILFVGDSKTATV
ncbi:MAG TPA: hypothetical protein VK616_12265, partial [Flavitalea sp.]|nr:hypothetical protein [Flavitalea sp.]